MKKDIQLNYDEFIFKKTRKTKADRARESEEAENKVMKFFEKYTNPVSGEELARGLGDGETIPTLCAVTIFDLVY